MTLLRLESEFWNTPWLTYRFRKYMAGPKRWPWKNQREIKRQYQYTWTVHFLIGSLLTWPLGVVVGRWSQKTQGGVPRVPINRFIHDFINLDPTHYARRRFRRFFVGTCVAGGMLFAFLTTDGNYQRDEWYMRPDLKPFKAMVAKEDLDVTEKTAYESHYQSFRNKMYKEEKKNRTWYRLFFPLNADYSVKRNPYSDTHKNNVYNPYKRYYHTIGNTHFSHHLNE